MEKQKPIYSKIVLSEHYFFIPNRMQWTNYTDFLKKEHQYFKCSKTVKKLIKRFTQNQFLN